MTDQLPEGTAWGRVARVTAYWPPTGFVGSHANFFEDLGNGLEISDLRMQFTIEKKLAKDPNTCKLVITNASAPTRARLVKKPLTIRLEAGHAEKPRFLFLGNLRFGENTHDKTDWSSTLTLHDGGTAYAFARVNRSYKPGTRARVVLQELAKSIGVVLPDNIANNAAIDAVLGNGEILDGYARDELTRLFSRFGYSWSIQDGKLQALRDDEVRADRAWNVDADAGVVGTPSYGAPDEKGTPPVLTVKMLLFPELTPGGKIAMATNSINGVHRIQEVKHTGDTRGNDWYTEVKAVQVSDVRR